MVGAGLRGAQCYGPVALEYPDRLRFVAVVEPNEERRSRFADAHRIAPSAQFASVDQWAAAGRLAPGAVIATPDRQHVAPAIAALEAGYHVLLEKPLAPTAAECLAVVAAARSARRSLQVCHVLRYTAFFRRLHEIVRSGMLGTLVTVEHRENVAYWHMAHSYVRGAYGDTTQAAPMLLAKSCHDLDVILWNLGEPCSKVASFGSLRHFRETHAPAGAPERCTQGCPVEDTCSYAAAFLYLGRPDPSSDYGWRPVTPLSWMPLTDHGSFDPATGMLTETAQERWDRLEEGPYGRCVYRCHNDAVDHQVVTMEMASGTSVVLAVHGHSDDDQRTMRYDGTEATLFGRFGDFSGQELTVHHHRSGHREQIPIESLSGLHGGGDVGIMLDFADGLAGATQVARTEAAEALESHLLGFAAEEARHHHQVVDLGDWRRTLGHER